MSEGFFSLFNIPYVKVPESRIAECGTCGLLRCCNSPQMPVSGKGGGRILVCGEAPGSLEDEQNLQFVGASGQRLQQTLEKLDVKLRRDCWVTNALLCRPTNKEGKNRKPTDKEIGYCRPNLINAIRKYEPDVVILLGGVPLASLIGNMFEGKLGGIRRWAGFQIPLQKYNCWVCPTYHPSWLLREESPVKDLIFEQHLEAAFKLEGKPWNKIPDYKSKVELIFKPREAAIILREWVNTTKLAAWDYETTCLKPEYEGAEIISCSVCKDGEKTISYPWSGEAIDATFEFLQSPCGKIASNMKFEERWTRFFFGQGVKNWDMDTMIASHWLDQRSWITSIKFQAFVMLGVPSWNERISPYLKSGDGSHINRIKQLDIRSLLMYNGLDSLYEYEVAQRQKVHGGGRWE
jgi:uracil-DNA glycosylase family 4